jgi:hypothetical protein
VSISRLSYVKCDGCGDPTTAVSGGAREARHQATQEGYIRRGGLDLCPRCETRNRRG